MIINLVFYETKTKNQYFHEIGAGSALFVQNTSGFISPVLESTQAMW